MEWGRVSGLAEGGALVELAGGERRRPMPVPRGLGLQPGDRVLVEKVGGGYVILAGYGGGSDE